MTSTWPGDVVLVAIIRDGHAQAPDPDGTLEAGDELLFVTAQDYEQELADMLSPAGATSPSPTWPRHPAGHIPTSSRAGASLPTSPSR